MADMTKCAGYKCPVKTSCKRYTEPSSPVQPFDTFDIQRNYAETTAFIGANEPCWSFIKHKDDTSTGSLTSK